MINLSLKSSNILIIGRKTSGKTHLIKHLIKNSFKETDTGLIFNYQENCKLNYENVHGVCNVYCEYNSEAVNNYVNKKSKDICLGDKPNEKKTFIVFDDILNDKLWNENKQDLLTLIYNGRYLNSLNIFSFQYLDSCLKKNVVDNFDYIFILKSNIDKEKRKLYKLLDKLNFFSFEIFEKLLNSLDNYESLVLYVKENKLFLYKTENPEDFEKQNLLTENKTTINYLKSLFW